MPLEHHSPGIGHANKMLRTAVDISSSDVNRWKAEVAPNLPRLRQPRLGYAAIWQVGAKLLVEEPYPSEISARRAEQGSHS